MRTITRRKSISEFGPSMVQKVPRKRVSKIGGRYAKANDQLYADAEAVGEMDAAGIDSAILSLSAPGAKDGNSRRHRHGADTNEYLPTR
jgi:hypothetical protein